MKTLTQDSKLARRYAAAWLAVMQDRLSADFDQQLAELLRFLRENIAIRQYLRIGRIAVADRKKFLNSVCKKMFGTDMWSRLLDMLAWQERLFLFETIAEAVQMLSLEKQHVMLINLEVYPDMQPDEEAVFRAFFEQKTSYRAVGTFKTNQHLIAGVRMQGDTVLWECSIRKRLQAVRLL